MFLLNVLHKFGSFISTFEVCSCILFWCDVCLLRLFFYWVSWFNNYYRLTFGCYVGFSSRLLNLFHNYLRIFVNNTVSRDWVRLLQIFAFLIVYLLVFSFLRQFCTRDTRMHIHHTFLQLLFFLSINERNSYTDIHFYALKVRRIK